MAIGHESHFSCSFYGQRQFFLMLSTISRDSASSYLALFRNISPQRVEVFIVNIVHFVFAERAIFFSWFSQIINHGFC
jgi:hypothetical protein